MGVKGVRQTVKVTNNPSTIDQNQQLLVRFPNLGPNDVIVPGTARLAFTMNLDSGSDGTLVQNIGRAVVKKTTIKISGNEVMSIDDSDVYNIYMDLWRTKNERDNAQYQGIDTTANRNVTRIRMEAANADTSVAADKAVADAYGRRYFIPLDFELLETHMPFYQSAMGDRLEYELTFNEYSKVINASNSPGSYYGIENISLEFDMVTEPDLTRHIRNIYNGRLAILYDRVLRHRKIKANGTDTLWNINLNVPARSMKSVLLVFEKEYAPFERDSELFYNPNITKVEVTIEGVPNQLFSQGMNSYQMWDEARRFFGGGSKRTPAVANVAKDLGLADVTLAGYLVNKYALLLDLRTTDDDQLHGSGRRIENASEGITIQISKKAASSSTPLNIYLYVVMDAQLNIENGRLNSVVY